MVSEPSSRAHGRVRRVVRRCRLVFLLLLLMGLAALAYLDQVGLPQSLKRPLLEEIHERGLRLEFDRLRLRWDRGLVGEQVVLAEAKAVGGPELVFDEVVLEPNWRRLLQLKFELRALRLRGGSLAFPHELIDPAAFRINAVEAELRFLPDDRWELTQFTAEGLGLSLRASGTLTNASAVREWAEGTGTRDPGDSVAAWKIQLERVNAYARQWRFGERPQISLVVTGDAREPAGIQVLLDVEAESVESRWGTLRSLRLHSTLNWPTELPGVGRSDAMVTFRQAQTAWGEIQEGSWHLHWTQAFTNFLPTEVQWRLWLENTRSPWGESPKTHCEVRAYPDPEGSGELVGELTATSDALLGGLGRAETNRLTAVVRLDPVTYLPTRANYRLRAANVEFQMGTAAVLELQGSLQVREPATRVPVERDWAWWSMLEPLEWNCLGRVNGLRLQGVELSAIEFEADWNAPRMKLSRFELRRGEEKLSVHGEVDVATREARATGHMNLDAHELEPLLTPKTVQWLSRYRWQEPPHVQATVQLVLPEWGDVASGQGEFDSTLRLQGHVEAGAASFQGLPADSVELDFSYADQIWHLPRLLARRPEGTLELVYTEDSRTRDYHFKINSRIDPRILRPMVPEESQKAFELFDFAEAPHVVGDIRGRWRAPELIGAQLQLECTRLVFRDEPVDELSASIQFTNRWLTATDVQLRTGDQFVIAPGAALGLEDHVLHMTNVTARIDPMLVARAIGPKTADTLEPYHFVEPPRMRVEGTLNVKNTRSANLRFDVAGGPFEYWRFHVPEVQGTVHSTNDTVAIRELQAPFYNGRFDGHFRVNVGQPDSTPLQFEARIASADFRSLLADLHSSTNRVEGRVSVDLAVTQADARDWNSWQGFGQAELLDGFIWDIPLFGVFSPVLDALLPGMAKGRLSSATGTFTITNSIVRSDDLEMRAPLFRLAYRGAVDFEGRLDARVEARLLRDAWVIGPLVSLLFSPLTKVLEYQVTGTLGQPRLELIYIPKPLQAPFNPLGTLREIFREPPAQFPPDAP